MAIDKLAEALEQFVNAEDWDDARRIAEQNPDLLGDESLELLAESIGDYRDAEREDIAHYLEEHRNILLRSRQVGIPQAFEEANQHAAQAMEARSRQIAALRPASPAPLQAFVWQLIDATSPEEVDRVLGDHPDEAQSQEAVDYLDELMSRAQESGHTEALNFLREYHELLRTYYELPPLMRVLQEFMGVPTWAESREILEQHPELLGDQALATMDSLISEARGQGDDATAEALDAYRSVLQRARDVGIDKAIDEIMTQEEVAQEGS